MMSRLGLLGVQRQSLTLDLGSTSTPLPALPNYRFGQQDWAEDRGTSPLFSTHEKAELQQPSSWPSHGHIALVTMAEQEEKRESAEQFEDDGRKGSHGFWNPDMVNDPELDRRITRKFDSHILPWIFLLWLLAFIDRSNIGQSRKAPPGQSSRKEFLVLIPLLQVTLRSTASRRTLVSREMSSTYP